MESLNKRKQLPPSPQEKANILSYITFAWAIPIFLKGRKQTLDDDDLFQPLNEQKARTLSCKIQKSWNEENEKCKKCNKNPWLVNALKNIFGLEVLAQGLFLLFIECGLKILPPIFLNLIIKYHENRDERNEAIMYWSTFGITLCVFLNVIIMHAFSLSNLNLGLKMRIAVSTMIYNKCLKLSKSSLANVSLGKIVNLLSSDVGRFDSTAFGFHYLWVGPIQTIIVTALIYNEIGVSSFSGVAMILLMIPLQLFLGKTISQLRMKTAIRTDRRIKLMNEIIQGIQVIKMYAWEKPMSALVAQARDKEIRMIRFVSWIKGITLSLMLFSSRVSIFTSLVIFAALNNVLTAQKAFVVTAYFNVLRQTMVIMYPLAINNVAECRVAIKRIEQLLFIKDRNDSKIESKALNEKSYVNMENVTAKWSDAITLENINLKIKSPLITAVIGKVGCGKSSLIQTLLNELPIESGHIEMNGKISYASQKPWLFSSSVKQNILFGLPLNKNRYNEVIKACCLRRDFELWLDGDETIVGERGMSLSGGQKARINLARAVYREADIYLLDNQLSAVDSHVQRYIFENCLKEFLKNKIVIFVTHQLHYLQSVDQIVLLNNGKIQASGSFKELKDTGLDFTKYLPENDEQEKFQRSISKQSQTSLNKPIKEQDDKKKIERVEKRAEGSIGWKIYDAYFRATGGYLIISFIMLFFVIAQVMASAGDYFLTYWVSKEALRNNFNQLVSVMNEIYDRYIDIYIFSALTVATVFLTLGRSFMFFNIAMRASRNLHDAMFCGITRATMFFFNTNPSGRILNRFSKDLAQIDELLPFKMIDVFQIVFSLLGIISVLAVVNQFYLIPTFIMFVIFYLIRQVYLKISLDVKRLSSTTSSPIFSYLSETLNGLSTIRAFKLEEQLKEEFHNHLDLNTSSHYICSGNVGLAITQAMSLTGIVQLGMRQSAVLENVMTGVERVVEYQSVDPEPEFESIDEKKPPREKIGIVGHTGGGKSSIINALFRLSYLEGTIHIDMREIQQMGLHNLRSKISIIPQEPVLFSGTMRYNLDPSDEYSDDKLWTALDEVDLKEVMKEMPAGLNTKISEGGSNFSVGQRQLIATARAVLRENKILVMDEATANVDLETDALIQKTIRNKFAECTVLTIAHRLNTIMDSDRILVMDAGKCVEFGTPHELLMKKEVFYGMLKETGKMTFDNLSKVAEEDFGQNIIIIQ